MIADAQAMVLLILGGVTCRLALTDAYLAYLRPSMKLPLIAAGATLVALSAATLATHWRTGRHEPDARDDHDDHRNHHDHEAGPRIGWLLLAPVAVLFLVAPAALGADAARRSTRKVAPAYVASYPPLPAATDGAANLSLVEFTSRAAFDSAGPLKDTPVRLIGFVARDTTGAASFLLTRFVITCCAADGFPLQVPITGAPSPPPENTWVAVTGRLSGTPAVPALRASAVATIAQPTNPYE